MGIFVDVIGEEALSWHGGDTRHLGEYEDVREVVHDRTVSQREQGREWDMVKVVGANKGCMGVLGGLFIKLIFH